MKHQGLIPYLLSYDLHAAKSEDYKKLDQALKEIQAEKLLETQWLLYRRESTANNVFMSIKHLFDGLDFKLTINSITFNCFGWPPSVQRIFEA